VLSFGEKYVHVKVIEMSWKPSDDHPNQEYEAIAELSIGWKAALYIGETWIRVGSDDGDQVLSDWRSEFALRRNTILVSKRFGDGTPGVNLSLNELNTGMWNKLNNVAKNCDSEVWKGASTERIVR